MPEDKIAIGLEAPRIWLPVASDIAAQSQTI